MGAEEHYRKGDKEYPIGAFTEDEHRENNADNSLGARCVSNSFEKGMLTA